MAFPPPQALPDHRTHRHRRCRRTIAALLALLSAPAPATEPPRAALDRFRVTIIGVDGATWRVIDPMLARGDLPHLARLLAHGARAPLRSRIPLKSPAVWTTIATGVRRERHGIADFFGPTGDLAASTDRRAPALWALASRAGLRSAVIGWWVTYPAETINGVIVSERALATRDDDLQDLLEHSPARVDRPRLIHPAEAVAQVADLLADLPERNAEEDEAAATVRRMRAEDAVVARLLVRLRGPAGPFDLEMLLLRGTDPVSHYFWKFHEPDAAAYPPAERPPPDEVTRHGQVIQEQYRHVDTLLGELHAMPTPDGVVMVLSDHGFEAGHQPFRNGVLSGTHETPAALDGILIASGGPIRPGVRLARATITDVMPTALHLLGLPVAQRLDGRVLTDLFDPGWLAAHPVRTVSAYPGPPVALPAEAAPASPGAPAGDHLRQQLRALGYVE